MNISELSLRRPVMAMVLSIIIVLFGFIGFKFLGVRIIQPSTRRISSVRTSYAVPIQISSESQITEPLEKAINGIAGVKNITSSSSQGTSNINVEFELGRNSKLRPMMYVIKYHRLCVPPPDLDAPPVVTKADASSTHATGHDGAKQYPPTSWR